MFKSLQFKMAEYDLDASPGLWRSGPIWIRNEATGKIVYEGPEHEVVPELIDALVEQLSEHGEAPPTTMPIVRAAMAHLNLVMIHPSRDGNGRMARCLQTLVLAREGILVPEFSSIEEYLGRNTQSYYDVLAEVGEGGWHPENDARRWVRFCLQAHYIQAASVLRRVRESEVFWGHLEDLIQTAGVPERTIEALFDASLGLRVRNSSYRSNVARGREAISNQTATTDLRQLVDAGLLMKHGAKRGTYYRASPLIDDFRMQLRSARTPIVAEDLFDPFDGAKRSLFD